MSLDSYIYDQAAREWEEEPSRDEDRYDYDEPDLYDEFDDGLDGPR